MATFTSDMTMTRGRSFVFQLSVGNLSASGLNAFNDARFTAKRDLSDLDVSAALSKSLGSGVTFTTIGDAATDGVVSVTIAPADTEALPSGYTIVLFYDLSLYDAAGDAYTVATGQLIVTPSATQATS